MKKTIVFMGNTTKTLIKTVVITLLIIFCTFSMISCDSNVFDKLVENKEKEGTPPEGEAIIPQYVIISFSTGLPTFSRKAIPDSEDYGRLKYRLTGIEDNSEDEQFLGFWDRLELLENANLRIHTGPWKLILTAYSEWYSDDSSDRNSEYIVLQGICDITLSQSTTIPFVLKEIEDCKVNGSFEYTVYYPSSSNWAINATILNADDFTETNYDTYTYTYGSYTTIFCNNILSGNYLLKIQFVYTTGDDSFESFTMPLIQIAAGLKTTDSKTLSANELTNFYAINYVYMDNATMTTGYAESYTPYKAVVLENPTRENYKFLGWYYNSDWSDENKLPVNADGKYVLNQNHDCENDLYVYARWLRMYYEQNGFSWSLSDDGVLTISGEGDVPFYAGSFSEWQNATSVIVEEGITGFAYNYYSDRTGFNSNSEYGANGRNIRTVSLPSTLTSISNSCFKNCTSLETINIPENVTSIATEAFNGCNKLEALVLPSGVTEIGENVFKDCTAISAITIPASVTVLRRNSFTGWTDEQEITLDWSSSDTTERNIYDSDCYTTGTSAQYNDGKAAWFSWTISDDGVLRVRGNGDVPFASFEEWRNATSVVVEEGITGFVELSWSYGHKGFSNYYDGRKLGYTDNIESIILPSTFTWICENCFYGCSSLKEINIPEHVTIIKNNAFGGCTALEEIVIPSSVASIGDYAFCDCTNLNSITISNGILSIGENAFRNCTSIESITIPSSVTIIRDYAFAYCTGISSITVPATVTEQFSKNVFQGWRSNQTITLEWNSNDSSHAKPYVPYSNTFSSHVTGESLGLCNYNGTHAKYRNGVYAWNGCTLNAEGTTIVVSGEGAGCPYNNEIDLTNVTSIIVQEGITHLMRHSTPETNTSVKTVNLPSSLVELGPYVFKNFAGIEEIVIPESVAYIGYDAFNGCDSLSSINLPQNITEIRDYSFNGCSSLQEIELPGALQNIRAGAFSNSGLTSISIPSGVTSIETNAFRECSSLSSISLPATLTSIAEYAFYKCTGFTALTIPSSVTEIGSSAFDYCTNNQTITLDWNAGDTTERTIASDAFGYAGVVVKYKDGTTYGN